MSIEVKNLSLFYVNRQVLHDISFSVEKGTLLSVLGQNGAGKSSLFRCILGLEKSYTGQVFVDGANTRSLSTKEMAKHIAYIPQSSSPAFNYSAFDIVLMGTTSSLRGLDNPKKEDCERVWSALDKLGICHLASRCYHRLSGGEQQLVLIARALSQNAGRTRQADESGAKLHQSSHYGHRKILPVCAVQCDDLRRMQEPIQARDLDIPWEKAGGLALHQSIGLRKAVLQVLPYCRRGSAPCCYRPGGQPLQ